MTDVCEHMSWFRQRWRGMMKKSITGLVPIYVGVASLKGLVIPSYEFTFDGTRFTTIKPNVFVKAVEKVIERNQPFKSRYLEVKPTNLGPEIILNGENGGDIITEKENDVNKIG